MIEKAKNYFSEHPGYAGFIMIGIGAVLLYAAIRGSKWLFEKSVNGSVMNLDKIDGWINVFGKKTARVVAGLLAVILISIGVFWFWIYS